MTQDEYDTPEYYDSLLEGAGPFIIPKPESTNGLKIVKTPSRPVLWVVFNGNHNLGSFLTWAEAKKFADRCDTSDDHREEGSYSHFNRYIAGDR